MYKKVALYVLIACLIGTGICFAQRPRKRVFAYYQVPALDRSADESLSRCKNVMTDLAPTIIEITDGLGEIEVTPEVGFFELVKGTDIAISPLIRNLNFDKKIAKWALLSPSAQRRMVEKTLAVLESEPRYSGLVVDIENTSPGDRDHYTEFVRRLHDALHPKGYKLYVVVGPKETDIPVSLWVRAFDYKAIGECCDYMILMTYNLHWRGGPPGPVAPVDWVERCTRYAISCVPAEKVIVGIPFYGYDWPEKGPATSLTWKKASALIERVKPDIQWHATYATPWFTYEEKGTKHEVWFEDTRSVQAKLDMCKRLGVGGVAIWRLGDENPEFWQLVGKYSKAE